VDVDVAWEDEPRNRSEAPELAPVAADVGEQRSEITERGRERGRGRDREESASGRG